MQRIFWTYLFCTSCNKDTLHSLKYVIGILKSVQCEECKTRYQLPREKLIKFYGEEALIRILTKPYRLGAQMKRAPNTFFFSLPTRLISKPFRVAHEIKEILDR